MTLKQPAWSGHVDIIVFQLKNMIVQRMDKVIRSFASPGIIAETINVNVIVEINVTTSDKNVSGES